MKLYTIAQLSREFERSARGMSLIIARLTIDPCLIEPLGETRHQNFYDQQAYDKIKEYLARLLKRKF